MSSKTGPRDGSRFPFDHFPGIILMWPGRTTGRRRKPYATPGFAGTAAGILHAVPDLRPPGTLHRSVSTYPTTKVAPAMISNETRAQIRRYFYAEHWKIGTIASELSVHPDAVRNAIESERFKSTQPMRPSIADA